MIDIKALAIRAIQCGGEGFRGATPLIRAIKYVRGNGSVSLNTAKRAVISELTNPTQ